MIFSRSGVPGIVAVAAFAMAFCAGAEQTNGQQRLEPVPLRNITVDDSFWAPKLKVYRERTIPWSWKYMDGELRALRKAAGEQVQGNLNGTWGEANLHKFLETAAHSLAQFPDAELERRVDEVIVLLGRAQQPDGYLHAYVTNHKKTPWDPGFLDGSHDGYVLGHMIEAAVAHHEATGKATFLDIARRPANQACDHFLGPRGRPGFDGHAELELALVKLYRVTHESRYLELARAFIEWRGRGKVPPFGKTPRAYFQDAAPLRSQRTLDGHAVRAIFFASDVAEVAIETGDGNYRLAANRFWDSTTMRRMTVTGSIGPRKEHEALGEDYELPNEGYYESCAACGLADFSQRLFMLERHAESCDVLDRVLYNAVLHGMSLDGTNSYYQNPLSDRNNLRYNSWVCCPPNLSRTLMKIGSYAYARSARDVFVNLFIGGTCRVSLGDREVTLRVKTAYPWEGQVNVEILTADPTRFGLHLRKPGWCTQAEIKLNGEASDASPDDDGYWTMDREWKKGDIIQLAMEMPVKRVLAHPNVTACRGKVALQRGPLVFGFEGLDNGGDAKITLADNSSFSVEHRPDVLGGITILHGVDSDKRALQAIPFYALANRGKSSQEVWVEQQGLKVTDDWWLGALYRALDKE